MNVKASDLDAILIGEPIEAMEAAKRIVNQNPRDPTAFIALATNKVMGLWTRIAAIWLLGFIDHDGLSVPDLERIVQDQTEVEPIRDHAAEAIAHRGNHRCPVN